MNIRSIYSMPFNMGRYLYVEPSKEGSTKNLFSARGLHKRADFASLLRAMEALPQAPWSGKAARFIANQSNEHLWVHVWRYFFFLVYNFWAAHVQYGAVSTHETFRKTFAFAPMHRMMTGIDQSTMPWTVTRTGCSIRLAASFHESSMLQIKRAFFYRGS